MGRKRVIVVVLLAMGLAVPSSAEAGRKLSLKTADRVNAKYVKNVQCGRWDDCADWDTTPCRRLSKRRAVCGGEVWHEGQLSTGTPYRYVCETTNYLKKNSFYGATVYDVEADCSD